MDRNEVAVALDIVSEEIENAIEGLNREGSQAFQKGEYDKARELMETGSQMTAFRDRVKALHDEWMNIFAAKEVRPPAKRGRRLTSRLRKGMRTPEDAYRIPILEALVKLGGSASMEEVLDNVYEQMKGQLNRYDMQPLPSNRTQIRWRNAAQWAKLALVKEGYMSSASRRGIWGITAKGKMYLQEQTRRSRR